MIKKIFNPLVQLLVGSAPGWTLAKLIGRLWEWLRFERSKIEHQKVAASLQLVFQDLSVRAGFFQGMKYVEYSSVGSSLFPKLAGSYESELFETLTRLEKRNYQQIIDIGCAEGYYAVGFARKFETAGVIAFDINPAARQLCLEMAKANEVANRVRIEERCTSDWLGSQDFKTHTLIFSDCEGFEKELFLETNVHNFSNCDLIIEMHPFVSPGIRQYLVDLFSSSHSMSFVSSHDNSRKIFDLNAGYRHLSNLEKVKLVEEGRIFTMDWIILEARN
jgi:hypothetical protein